MSERKNTTLLSTIAGLALCGFLTACGEAKTETPITKPDVSARKTMTINEELIIRAREAQTKDPSADDCREMIAKIMTPMVQTDRSPEMEAAKDIVFTRCPN